jgi:branched-subunit amino acid aminotransferase/4-amino-4-deoxychorismate lyase
MGNSALMYRWRGNQLEPIDYCDMTDTAIVAADSWLVSDGATLAIDAHKERFFAAAGRHDEFWEAVVATVPSAGEWFPRVEFHDTGRLLFRLRSAPERYRSVVVASHRGADPRTTPTIKGPDLAALTRCRTAVQSIGASEAVILSEDGYVVEGTTTALVWWRGSILCFPPGGLERVPSVTAGSLIALATALGVETFEEPVTPAELDGTELWALNALHGVRIVTTWVDGPQLAELPGRARLWRERLTALTR